MITGDQIRSGRALLRWSASTLAARSGVGLSTILRIERRHDVPHAHATSISRIEQALIDAGLLFISEGSAGIGVRFRDAATRDSLTAVLEKPDAPLDNRYSQGKPRAGSS